jgi:hypothetical protein
MRFFDSHWERVRLSLTPRNVRVALTLVSIVAMVLGGAASDRWD